VLSLDGCSRAALEAALEAAPDATAAVRVMAALAYRDGVDVAAFADRYGIPRSTVYAWLHRFEDRPPAEAMLDVPRSGRPSKLDAASRTRLRADLERPPTAFGFEATAWDAGLLEAHLGRAYDVSYSRTHARRLLAELGGAGRREAD